MGCQQCSRLQQILHGVFRIPSLKATACTNGWVSAVLVLFKRCFTDHCFVNVCVLGGAFPFLDVSRWCERREEEDVNRVGQVSWLSLSTQQCPLAVNRHQHKGLNLDTGSTKTKIFKTFSLIYNHALGGRWKYQTSIIKFHTQWRLSRAEMYKLTHL